MKSGRKPIPEEERRSHVIALYLTIAQKEKLFKLYGDTATMIKTLIEASENKV